MTDASRDRRAVAVKRAFPADRSCLAAASMSRAGNARARAEGAMEILIVGGGVRGSSRWLGLLVRSSVGRAASRRQRSARVGDNRGTGIARAPRGPRARSRSGAPVRARTPRAAPERGECARWLGSRPTIPPSAASRPPPARLRLSSPPSLRLARDYTLSFLTSRALV